MDSPGTYEDGRVSRNECESSEPLIGCLGRPLVGTAKAPHITCQAGKLWRAGEWGGWGRISDDGPGQHNPDRSEGPWGRAAKPLARRRHRAGTALRLRAKTMRAAGDAKAGCKPWRGADRSAPPGKAPTERPALEPYRGKPAVRNLRGDDGNVGIIRSPISAIVLPDPYGGASNSTLVERRGHIPSYLQQDLTWRKTRLTIRTAEPPFIPQAHSEGSLESFCQCQTVRTFPRERCSRLECSEQGCGRPSTF
jgi:hypothetical protein